MFFKLYIKMDKNYKVWWYWNWKIQTSQTQKPYFDRQYRC